MKKRIAIIAALLTLTASMFIMTGCGGSDNGDDMAYVQDKGTLVVGITDFAPMDYKDSNGEWIGFDADLAKAFADKLGVEVEFVEIDWDSKEMELDNKSIDCVWNGMTITDAVKEAMEVSNAYCKNAQVVVLKADVADKYQDKDSLKDLTFAAEAGSAGAEVIGENGWNCVEVQTQAAALMEVEAGTADACVIDLLMAGAMIGEGTSYTDLTTTVELNSEEYGVGFRKESNLAEELNKFMADEYASGNMLKVAKKYGLGEKAVIEQ